MVGRVLRAHGIQGDVKIEVHSDVAGRFARGQRLLLIRPGNAPGQSDEVEISTFRAVKDGALVRFAGIAGRDAAEALRGGRLEVSRELVPPAPDGTYYFFELVGCRCVDKTAGHLGTVEEVVEDGGGLLLEVHDDARSVLVPFVAKFLESVDVAAGRIALDLPPGLVETCVSKS